MAAITLFVLTWLAFAGLQMLYVTTQARIGHAYGAAVEAVSVGIGPVVCKRRIGSAEYFFKLLPFGGSTKFRTQGAPPEVEPAGVMSGTPLHQIACGRRILIMLGGPASSLALGLLLFGAATILPRSGVVIDPAAPNPIKPSGVPGLAASNRSASIASEGVLLTNGVMNFLARLVTLRPLEGWGGPISWMVTSVAAGLQAPGAWLTCFGAICLGHGIINLAPIPPLNGGQVLMTGLEWLVGRLTEKAQWVANVVGVVVTLVLFLRVTYLDLVWFSGLLSSN